MTIVSRFCGPPESGNGGYCAGLLATALGGAVEVTLRKPPPLETALELAIVADRAQLKHGDTLIAEGKRSLLELEPPRPPSFERAAELSQNYVGHQHHHFPTCFVCGPARAEGDGLRIFPGAAHDGEPVAAPWQPDGGMVDTNGNVPRALLWAALDCVGYFAVGAPDYPVALLGRMTGEVVADVHAAERCVVLGWSLGREGRKLHAGTAIFGEDGALRGLSRQTWILLVS